MDFNFKISRLRGKKKRRERRRQGERQKESKRKSISFFALEMFIDFGGYEKIKGRKQTKAGVQKEKKAGRRNAEASRGEQSLILYE